MSSVVIIVVAATATSSELSLGHGDISLSNVLLVESADCLVHLLLILQKDNSKSCPSSLFLLYDDITVAHSEVLEEIHNLIFPHSEWKTAKLAASIHITWIQELRDQDILLWGIVTITTAAATSSTTTKKTTNISKPAK